jgi:hypothetical protein
VRNSSFISYTAPVNSICLSSLIEVLGVLGSKVDQINVNKGEDMLAVLKVCLLFQLSQNADYNSMF